MGLPFENADYNEDEVGAKKIPELTDVVLTNIQNNEILVYNNGIWENQAQSGGSSITELDDIPGVTITNAQDNQFLKYDNGEWINANITDNDTDNLEDLTDTLLTSPFGNDEVLKYLNGKWVNGNIPIEKLSNVYISNIQDGETLRYVQQNGRWENANNIDTLNELEDVTVSSNLQNHVLKYNNTLGVYKNDFLNLTDLGDTNITTLVNDYSLIYNNGIWSAGKVNINNLNGLTWSGLNNNEIIRKTSSTTADGAGMTLHDTSSPTFPQTSYFKDVSYFGRHGQSIISFGVNRFESTFVGYNQRIIPYAPILLSTTPVSGLYLHHAPSINNYNVRVGVNIQYPSQDFQVGTTMYVDDTNKRVGIKTATPNKELEVVGEARISNNGTQTLSFYDTSHSHEHGTVATHQAGSGARMDFHVKNASSGALTNRLNINETGSITFANPADYGTLGQVLNSNGNNPPSWTNDLDQMRTTTTFNINCPLQLGGSYGLGTGGQAVLAGNASLTHPSWIDIYDLLYPVGSVKIMYGTFGGFPGQQWVEFGQGRVLVGLNAGDTDFDTIGEEGGFKEIALTEAQMPRHSHVQDEHNHNQNAHGHTQSQTTLRNIGVSGMIVGAHADGRDSPYIRSNGSTYGTTATNIPTTATNQFTGGTGTAQTASNGQAHNNLQPYIVVRYYRRTS